MIVRLLSMYEELSLPQFSKIMRKNKTTIQYHLQVLKDHNIIITSRESQADSRGSIATKYYKLKEEEGDYHVYLSDYMKINDFEERLSKYKEFLLQLDAGIKDLVNKISLAEKSIEKSLEKVEELSQTKITKDKLDDLHNFIKRINLGYSTIALPESIYFQNLKDVSKFLKGIAKSSENYLITEKRRLQHQNFSKEDVKKILRTDPKYIGGHEIIAIFLPLKEIIDSLLV